jgi:hypothetical protein
LFSAGFSGTAIQNIGKSGLTIIKMELLKLEEMVSGSSSSSANLTSTFTVPTSALQGPTRMRVSMKYNAAQTACEAFSYGEVEDYTVNIGAAVTTITTAKVAIDLGNEDSISDVVMYPNLQITS